jgi:colanic acid/amylovoran biosynthesis glycosyltransferase
VPARPLKITYLFTTFPKATETFLQREVAALLARGAQLRLYSLINGGGTFAGVPVRRFSMWRLLELFWLIPWYAATRWDVFSILLRGLLTRRAPGWLNFWENMLGAGFVAVFHREFRRDPPDLVHAAWAGGPATAAWILHRLEGYPYSVAAHAYDLYEHGGDWWLMEKLELARFIHTSTEMGRESLLVRGVPAEKIHVIRRGLPAFPQLKPLRRPRTPLRLVSIARLVPKKGLQRQLQIHAALQRAGVAFEARIIGEGPLRPVLEQGIRRLGLQGRVVLLGHLPEQQVWEQLAWADVLLHTGVVAASGDRDGLPNVIPEAMAAGTLVVSSTAAATTEAVRPEETGTLADVEEPARWVEALQRLRDDEDLAERLRQGARQWVEANYDARQHAERMWQLFQQAVHP